MTRLSVLAAFAAIALPMAAAAQEKCNFESNSGQMAESSDLTGVAACTAFCTESDGCGAWLYTPHNFNPTGAPGHCQLYAEASGKREPDASASNQFCGMIE